MRRWTLAGDSICMRNGKGWLCQNGRFLGWPVFFLAVLLFGASCADSSSKLPDDAFLLKLTWQKSDDAATQQAFYYDFVWESFIALNWPNVPIEVEEGKIVKGFRGEPIAKRDLILEQRGAGPLKYISVWETYREPAFEVFLSPNTFADYPKWNTPRPPVAGLENVRVRPLLGYNNGDFVEYATDLNQPDFFPSPTGPLIDQNGNYVRYEVAVNQAFFTYIRHFGYFNPNLQIRGVQNALRNPKAEDGFQLPPHGTPEEFKTGYLKDLPKFARQGLIDVKAAWRVLDLEKGDKPERYLHREVVTGEGRIQLMGLVALHILRFTPDGQVASTFEQVDNLSGDADAGVKASFNTGAQPSDVQRRLGFQGAFPPAVPRGANPPANPEPVSIYRVTPLPKGVVAANKKYQNMLKGSVFEFYELIGTQNKHPGKPVQVSFDTAADRAVNGPEGPVTGVYSNTNNLVNAALESYTQANHSCLQCHIWARPIGVPTQAKEVDGFKTLTFLLQAAQHPSTLNFSKREASQDYLGVGEYLLAENDRFFTVLQQDGNFCVFRGRGPESRGERVWCSGRMGSGNRFFAALQADGNFCVFQGDNPKDRGQAIWCSGGRAKGAQFFAEMQDDGRFCIYKGSPGKRGIVVWCSPKP